MASGALDRIAEAGPTSSPMTSPQGPAVYRTPSQYNRKRSLPDSGEQHASYPMTYSISGSSLYSESASSQGSSFYSSPVGPSPFDSPEAGMDVRQHLQQQQQLQQHLLSPSYDAADAYDALLRTPTHDALRPDMKRRKTAPADLSPHKSPGKRSSPERKGTGKDGAEVWPQDVEDAFYAALKIIPKLGRRKVLVNGKPCGRNELIADYIYRHTNKLRSRKQVSSHIQVLKNMKRDDPEFMKLVSEPLDGVDDAFSPQAITAFGGGIQACTNSPSSVAMGHSYSEGLLAPMPTVPPLLYRSSSCGPSPLLSPAISDCSSVGSALPSPFLNGSPISAALTTQFKDMHFPFPPQPESKPNAVPIAPLRFRMWADSNETGDMHTFSQLSEGACPMPPNKTVFLEDLPNHEHRYPGLAKLHERAACQFLHLKLNLVLPRAEDGVMLQNLNAVVELSAQTDQPLAAVTTLYSYGTEVLTMNEALAIPSRIADPSSGSQSATSSPASLDSPVTPASAGNSPANSLRHKYRYRAPFARDFWRLFLHGGEGPTGFAKEYAERKQLGIAVDGLSVVQEFIVPFDESMEPPASPVSRGSAAGDVVLVLVYEFKTDEADPLGPMSSLTAEVSFLSSRDLPAHKLMQSPSRPNAPRRPSCLSYETVPELDPSGAMEVKSAVPEIQLQGTAAEGTALRPGRSPTKPNLSLNIPTPGLPLPGQTPPITPWPQMIQTPNCPPPVQAPTASGRHRLGQAWANTSGDWNMNSPALEAFSSHMLASSSATSNNQLSAVPQGSAIQWLTADAIAAGTPIFTEFPRSSLAYGTPFGPPGGQSHSQHTFPDHDYFGTLNSDVKSYA